MNNTVNKVLNGIILAIGIWLVISPFVFSYTTYGLWNSVICGGLAIVFAGVREWTADNKNNWANWTNMLLGVWLIAAPFMFVDVDAALWSSLISGAVIAALAGWSLVEAQVDLTVVKQM